MNQNPNMSRGKRISISCVLAVQLSLVFSSCCSVQAYIIAPLNQQNPDLSVSRGWSALRCDTAEPHIMVDPKQRLEAVRVSRNTWQWLAAVVTIGLWTPMTVDCLYQPGCPDVPVLPYTTRALCGIDVASAHSGPPDTTVYRTVWVFTNPNFVRPTSDLNNAYREVEFYQDFCQKLASVLTLGLYNPYTIDVWRERCSTEGNF